MTQVDFIIAMSLVIAMISLVVFSSSSNFSSGVGIIDSYIIRNSESNLKSYLFESLLAENIKEVQIRLEESSGYAHQEQVTLNMDGNFDNLHLYDERMSEITTSISGDDVSFTVSFSSNEDKYFNVFYVGDVDDLGYDAVNVSAIILSQKDFQAVSLDKCSVLNYDEIKNMVGSDFKIELDGCDLGPEPTESGNIAASEHSLLIFDDEGLHEKTVRITLW